MGDQNLQPPCKITELNWTLHLFDGDTLSENIEFRSPYALYEDQVQDFKTGLYQLNLAFERIKSRLQQPEEGLELITIPPFISWTLTVTQQIIPQQKSKNLWAQNPSSTDKDQLTDLQNKLPTAIESFTLKNASIPSYDFATEQAHKKTAPTDFFNPGHHLLPFYIYPKPQPLEVPSFTTTHFIERTTSDWWDSKDPKDSYRDYYMVEENSKWLWAFRNNKGDWFKHGLYS